MEQVGAGTEHRRKLPRLRSSSRTGVLMPPDLARAVASHPDKTSEPVLPPAGSAAEFPTPRTIRDKDEEVLSAIGDSSSRKILLTLDASPRPVHDVVRALDLPQSTVYHKLHELERAGLVAIQSIPQTPEGKHVELFRSLVKSVRMEMVDGKVNVRIRYREIGPGRLGSVWQVMREKVRR